MKRFHCRGAGIVLPICILVAMSLLYASSVLNNRSFEETFGIADAVVRGRVVESPHFGTYEGSSGTVIRAHRFQVDQYFKGSGPTYITVETLGGPFLRDIDGDGTEETLTRVSGGQPQLPPEYEEVLLFLTRYGGADRYMICSLTHGVRRVNKRERDGEPVVTLDFENPYVMTESARAAYERQTRPEGQYPTKQLITDSVPVGELVHVVDRLLHFRAQSRSAAKK